MTSIRAFADTDYPGLIDIHNRVYPEDQLTINEYRYMDEAWDLERYFRYRVVAEDETGRLVGVGEIEHLPSQFHPDKYGLSVIVDLPYRRRGHGGAIYDHLADRLRERGAIAVRTWTKESEPDGHRFVTHRGFVEARREWQSRLDVTTFDPIPFAGALERIAGQGIVLTNLAAERASNEQAVADVYQLDLICSRDVPDIDPHTDVPYDAWVKNVVDAPYALPEGFLIAKDGGRYVGVARLFASEEEPDVLYQGLTGVIPEYRGRGIAMALKLATVEFARNAGKREIRTWNDTMNRAMLRINEAMGFTKEPVEIVYLKDLIEASS